MIPAVGESIRLEGDRVAVKSAAGAWVSGSARISTPLPDGYAPPTAPGAIEIKRYAPLRRAETSGNMPPSIGMNLGFFPLFNHIKRRNIAMTSPVEMDYQGWMRDGDAALAKAKGSPDRWTMSFLYRSTDLGPAGDDTRDERVRVVDTPERLVVARGYQGGYGMGLLRSNLDVLAEWIAADGRYEVIGEPRALNYNGPEQRDEFKWAEVQLPVRPRAQGQ
ncbi:heme-binding protein [Synechococcus sp. Cruz CV-v-12]|uniref:heme-binding protein n=1 Tax=Synechococcus sp. Cruz CV-v-12 TaxID=2823728 RepID=UPI0020CE8D7C|nr:heme-binding protein [Synechococcus sp. Cruz CV-v-12]MCP9874831.1 heme-binding protein [Synechococcus sp. Cruz CV-v-12]